MSQPLTAPPASRLSMVQWLICVIAAIGFAFDIYELLMLPLIVRPALMELGGIKPGTPEFANAVGQLFYIPAFAGGIFGLLGGYLTDRLGRRRVLTWSILLYAVSAFAAGFSTSFRMLLILRCTTFIGVCIEFVAAVAWLAELFPNPQQREKVLGYTQAFSSVGGLLVAFAYGLAVQHSADLFAIGLPASFGLGEIKEAHAPWRYTLMSGLIPAIPLILIRPFLPESPVWQSKKEAGVLRRPSFAELFGPGLLQTTVVTTIMFACSYGAAFGAIQQIPQIVPGLHEVKEKTAGLPVPKQKEIEQKTAADYTKVQEIGGLLGRFLLAMLAVYIVSRRMLLRVFQIPGLFMMPLIFYAFGRGANQQVFTLAGHEITLLHMGIFTAGLFTVAQFSFWGNYLPRVYPVHLRGTGESFAANIGGRMIGTSFAYLAQQLALRWPTGSSAPEKMAYTAASIAFGVYFVGLVCSFFLPEPPAGEMED
ncbi:MAG TPA: MFS transporter [Planctomycetaceae bacterium]|nr:MFS transporter [Planctomycetaceae bacterium]